jgi:hypothetical protein
MACTCGSQRRILICPLLRPGSVPTCDNDLVSFKPSFDSAFESIVKFELSLFEPRQHARKPPSDSKPPGLPLPEGLAKWRQYTGVGEKPDGSRPLVNPFGDPNESGKRHTRGRFQDFLAFGSSGP